jgi:hypothetical protein
VGGSFVGGASHVPKISWDVMVATETCSPTRIKFNFVLKLISMIMNPSRTLFGSHSGVNIFEPQCQDNNT